MHRSPAEEKQRGPSSGLVKFQVMPLACLQGAALCSTQWKMHTFSPFLLIPCGLVCPLSCPLVLEQNNHCCSEIFTLGARGSLLFGFKNRTFQVDFYGLVKNTARSHPHLVFTRLVPGRSVDSSRKHQVDSALRSAPILAAPPPGG